MTKSKGLGDTIEKITKATGIKHIVEEVSGWTSNTLPVYGALFTSLFVEPFDNLFITVWSNNLYIVKFIFIRAQYDCARGPGPPASLEGRKLIIGEHNTLLSFSIL